jgi:hypothetical protein
MSHVRPFSCVGEIPTVRGVIASEIASGSIASQSKYMSRNQRWFKAKEGKIGIRLISYCRLYDLMLNENKCILYRFLYPFLFQLLGQMTEFIPVNRRSKCHRHIQK